MRPKISSTLGHHHLAGKLDEPGIGDQNDLRVALGRLAARQDDAHPVALGMKHHMLVGKPKHPTCPEQAVEPNGGQDTPGSTLGPSGSAPTPKKPGQLWPGHSTAASYGNTGCSVATPDEVLGETF